MDELKTQLAQATIRGDDLPTAVKNIADRMDVSRSNAARLVMTESAYFATKAQQDCFNELGVEKVEFVATLDDRTSPECQALDGTVIEAKDAKPGTNAPPMHCWCRSCLAPYFGDKEGRSGTRAARDKETGKTVQVPAGITYPMWKAAFVDNKIIPIDIELGESKSVTFPWGNDVAKGMPPHIQEEIEKTLAKEEKRLGIYIDRVDYYDDKNDAATPFKYFPFGVSGLYRAGIFVNSAFDWEKRLANLAKGVYNKGSGLPALSSNDLHDLLLHELAHFATFKNCKTLEAQQELAAELKCIRPPIKGISRYNEKCEDGAETIAEAFVAMVNGVKVPPRAEELVRAYIDIDKYLREVNGQ